MSETVFETQADRLNYQRLIIRHPALSEWKHCRHCGNTSYKTEVCPTCTPTIRPIHRADPRKA